MVKVKNNIIIKVIISSLVLLSSMSVFAQIIAHYTKHDSKNLVTIRKDGGSSNFIKSKRNSQNTDMLINNLTSIKDYIKNTVLDKQHILEHSILGHSYNKKKYKKSQIAWLNEHSTIKKNRYTNQARATIENSNNSLKIENKKLSMIISIITNHKYNYEDYLNDGGYIIPNIDFFTKNNTPSNSGILKVNNITSNLYNLNNNNTSINSISLGAEEDLLGAKVVSIAGSSLAKVVFNQISFKAKIISFNKNINSYQYAVSTSYKNSSVLSDNNLSENSYIQQKNTKISESNQLIINNLYNKYNLTKLIFAQAQIQYNNIADYSHNKVLYSLVIVIPVFLVTIFHTIIVPVAIWPASIIYTIYSINKSKKKIASDQPINYVYLNDSDYDTEYKDLLRVLPHYNDIDSDIYQNDKPRKEINNDELKQQREQAESIYQNFNMLDQQSHVEMQQAIAASKEALAKEIEIAESIAVAKENEEGTAREESQRQQKITLVNDRTSFSQKISSARQIENDKQVLSEQNDLLEAETHEFQKTNVSVSLTSDDLDMQFNEIQKKLESLKSQLTIEGNYKRLWELEETELLNPTNELNVLILKNTRLNLFNSMCMLHQEIVMYKNNRNITFIKYLVSRIENNLNEYHELNTTNNTSDELKSLIYNYIENIQELMDGQKPNFINITTQTGEISSEIKNRNAEILTSESRRILNLITSTQFTSTNTLSMKDLITDQIRELKELGSILSIHEEGMDKFQQDIANLIVLINSDEILHSDDMAETAVQVSREANYIYSLILDIDKEVQKGKVQLNKYIESVENCIIDFRNYSESVYMSNTTSQYVNYQADKFDSFIQTAKVKWKDLLETSIDEYQVGSLLETEEIQNVQQDEDIITSVDKPKSIFQFAIKKANLVKKTIKEAKKKSKKQNKTMTEGGVKSIERLSDEKTPPYEKRTTPKEVERHLRFDYSVFEIDYQGGRCIGTSGVKAYESIVIGDIKNQKLAAVEANLFNLSLIKE